jgi:hypothetical protein
MSMMQPVSIPIVYVETNWVVALAVPHDRFHQQALALLADARDGTCRIRMPVGALAEGRERATSEMESRPRVLAEIRGLLENALLSGWKDLERVVTELRGEAVRQYFQHAPQQSIDVLAQCGCVSLLDDPRREHQQLVVLRSSFSIDHSKSFDRYVLAAVLADRATTDRDTAAILCSINTKQFKPSSAKGGLPNSVYEEARIYYSETFAWRDALPYWQGKFARKCN